VTDNLRIWNAVSKTDPAHTKTVNQRGGFTAISANYQILRATEQFGPIGIGWGYTAGDPVFHETLVIVPVTLWHGDRSNTFGPVYGCEEWKDSKGRIDSDAPKKAGTDGLTKLLSQLGFNADVFLGKFDDQKYVEQAKREFAEQDKPELPAGPINDATRDWISSRIEARQIPPGELCKAFNVTSLKALTYEQLDAVKAWIRDHKKEAA
jgi:hypothetical protein